MNPRISLITPVYHAEKTLGRAIDSFIACPGPYEMILVLDGEQDECARIAQEKQKEDPRIRLMYPHERMGAAKARGRGIAQAKGEYCCFLDADDRLAPNALERYETLTEEGAVDVVNVSFSVSTRTGQRRNAFTKSFRHLTREEAFAALMGDGFIRGFLWTKAIRRSLLLDGFRVRGKDVLFEDVLLSALVFSRAETFVYSPEPLTIYHKSEGATSVSRPRTNRSAYHLAAFASIRLIAQLYRPELLPLFFKARFRSYWSLWYDRSRDKKYGLGKEELRCLKREFNDLFDPKKPWSYQGTSYEKYLDLHLIGLVDASK